MRKTRKFKRVRDGASGTKRGFSVRGFTLLYTLLIISITLSISLGIFNIVIRELSFAESGKDSQIAFYAADAGVECALYADFKEDAIFRDNEGTDPNKTVECAGQTIGGTGPFTLYFFDDGSEVDVEATKEVIEGEATTTYKVTITAKGHNAPEGSANRVERAIRTVYISPTP